MSRDKDKYSGRGKGTRSNIEGRISGYETADFSIVNTLENTSMNAAKKANSSFSYKPLYKQKKELSLPKKIGLVFGFIIVILFLAGKLSDSDDNSRVITPENAMIKPTAFTRRLLAAEDSRDKKLEELLKDGWTMSNNEKTTDTDFVTVGKKWDAIETNSSPIINIVTSYEYEYNNQDFGTSGITLTLQELKENAGINLDSTATNILKIYNKQINIDSINSSVQTAYNAAHNCNSYNGNLSFDKDYMTIEGEKNGELVTVTISILTTLTSS